MSKVLPILIAFFVVSCSSNRDSEMDLQEMLNEIQKSTVDDDKDKVESEYEIKTNYIVEEIVGIIAIKDLRNEIKRTKKINSNAFKLSFTIGERYVNGDLTMKTTILNILKDSIREERMQLLTDLNPYTIPAAYELDDPDVVAAIEKALYTPDDEVAVAALMEKFNFPNYLKKLETHLLSGNSANPTNIFYTLAQEGKSLKTLNFIEKEIKTGNSELELYTVLLGFELLLETGDERIKKKVIELCKLIYTSGLIPEEDYKKVNEEINAATLLLDLIFEYGERWTLPIAKLYKEEGMVAISALNCLIRFEGEAHRKALVSLLKDESYYESAIELVPEYYEKTKDERILRSAILSYEKLYEYDKDPPVWKMIALVDEIYLCVKDSTKSLLMAYFNDPKMERIALEQLAIKMNGFFEVADGLFERGLITERMEPPINDKGELQNWFNFYDVLDASGIYFWYDSEEKTPVTDNDELLNGFQKISGGDLDGLELSLQHGSGHEVESIFKAYFNGKGYVFKVKKRSELNFSYILQMKYLVNYILKDQGYLKAIQTGNYSDDFMYGVNRKVSTFFKDYEAYL